VIDLINGYFVPVHLRNQDFGETGDASAEEKAEKRRIYREALEANLAAGSVCVYLLAPDARPVATAPLNQDVATDPKQLADLLQQVIRRLNLTRGEPVVPPAPPSPPECERDSLVLRLTTRYLQRRGDQFVRLDTGPVLGTSKGGNWGDLPSQDWIVLDREEWTKLLPDDADVEVGTSWEPHRDIAAKLLTHFFPPTENTDLATNRIDEQSLTARVESIEHNRIRARLEGRLRMKHPFYHKDDDNFVSATLIGYLEFEPAAGTRATCQIRSLLLVTDRATYGQGTRGQPFGVVVRSLP
jgi:hypothetical protein